MQLDPEKRYVVRCGAIITLGVSGKYLIEPTYEFLYSNDPGGNLVLGESYPHDYDIMSEYVPENNT
jgi:hypothetical protein